MRTLRRPHSIRLTFRLLLILGALGLTAGFARQGSFARGAVSTTTTTPELSFGVPATIAVGDEGFEPDLALTSGGHLFSSVPNGFATSISFMWRSYDNGLSWHLVPASSPHGTGKPLTCAGGGDSELAVDPKNRLYFADLQGLTNFSTSRSDDGGASFTTSCAGVPASGVDRQWYAIDGDPLSGGHVFLTFDEAMQGDQNCPGQNELVITQSPPAGTMGTSQTSGVQFGPVNRVTCNEGIMGPDAVSPRTDPKYHNHYVFVMHDSSALDQVRVTRCVQVPATVDPSGLQCSDRPVYGSLGKIIVGQDFATMTIDRAGIIYAVWAQAPVNKSGTPDGPSEIMVSYSADNGNHWSSPVRVNHACSDFDCRGIQTATNVMPWVTSGDAGRIDIAWYGTPTLTTNNTHSGTYGSDTLNNANWKVYMAQSLNADSSHPTFTEKVVTPKVIHHGSLQVLPTQSGDRTQGDFMEVRTGPRGEADIVYVDSTRDDDLGQSFFVRQTSGPSLFRSVGSISSPAQPLNSVTDSACSAKADDAVYNANGQSSSFCKSNLDILSSRVQADTDDYDSLRITMKVADLTSLAPASQTADPSDTTVDWITVWHQACTFSSVCPERGHVWFAYMESTAGSTPVFYSGRSENVCCAFVTYPGKDQLTSATASGKCKNAQSVNCYIPGKPGTIIVDVPLKQVSSPLANSWLYSVTSSALTLPGPGNASTSRCGTTAGCGTLFNVIDSTPPYNAHFNRLNR